MGIVKRIKWPMVLLVILVILLAYGQTLLMYFWQDDSALIWKLMFPEGRAGSFGYGVIGSGAYKYLVTPFVPFFPLFGKEPFGYFLVGLITYGFAALAFYYFAKNLFKDKKAAYFATLIFSAGYIGSDTMFRVINSWQTNIGLILALFTLGMYIRYLKETKFKLYIYSVSLFFATIELVFIRSHSLVLAILFLDFVYRLIPFVKRRILGFIFRSVPFLLIFYKYYMSDKSFGAPGATSVLDKVFKQGDIVSLSPFFANFGNVLVPNVIQNKFISVIIGKLVLGGPVDSQVFWLGILVYISAVITLVLINKTYKTTKKSLVLAILAGVGSLVLNMYFYNASPLWYRNIQTVFAGGLSLTSIVLLIYYSYALWRKDKNLSRIILIGTFIAASQFIGYFVQYPTSIFASHHRYYSHTIIGTSVLFATIVFLWFRKFRSRKLFSVAPLLLILCSYLSLSIVYQRKLVLDRSLPSRAFYQDLLRFVPEIEKGSAFYFDVSKKGNVGTQFGDFFSVGSMPESTALGMYYNVDRYDVLYLTDFDELLFKISSGEVKLDKAYTFFVAGYDYKNENNPIGLINTTDEFRKAISKDKHTDRTIPLEHNLLTKYIEEKEASVSENIIIPITESISSITPKLITVTAILNIPNPPEIFPYRHVSKQVHDLRYEKELALSYLSSRKEYYENVEVESISDWKFREVDYAVDNNPQTVWQGHRIWWNKYKEEALTVDLGSVKNINRVIWKNWKTVLAPTSYNIEVSLNGENWAVVRSVNSDSERRDGEVAIEEFGETDARYVKMNIFATQTNDSPAILEFEVVESVYKNLDPEKALSYQDNPFYYIKDANEWEIVSGMFRPLATMDISWKSNKTGNFSQTNSIPVRLDGVNHEYEVVIPAGGTEIDEVRLGFNYPISGTIEKVLIRNITINELDERGLIKTFEDN